VNKKKRKKPPAAGIEGNGDEKSPALKKRKLAISTDSTNLDDNGDAVMDTNVRFGKSALLAEDEVVQKSSAETSNNQNSDEDKLQSEPLKVIASTFLCEKCNKPFTTLKALTEHRVSPTACHANKPGYLCCGLCKLWVIKTNKDQHDRQKHLEKLKTISDYELAFHGLAIHGSKRTASALIFGNTPSKTRWHRYESNMAILQVDHTAYWVLYNGGSTTICFRRT
jgi:hypothetical protein